MRKDRRMMVICFTVMSVWIFLFAGLNAQAALFLDPYPATSLIGIGNELDPSKLSIDGKDYQTHQDSPEIVNWLLDEYYHTDIDTLLIGKFEEDDGVLVPKEFNSLFQSSWFTWEGTILDATSGTGIVTIPVGFEWTGRLWYSIKAGNGFGL